MNEKNIQANRLETTDRLPRETYAIGIYKGTSPFALSPVPGIHNPVISRLNFPPGEVNFVADPFLLFHNKEWHLFFEVMPMGCRRGKIAYATSRNSMEWTYQGIVLEEPFHLSYPYVFKWKDEIYMIPETYENGAVSIYKANPFPQKWTYQKDLLQGAFVDASIIEYRGKWWLFACATPRSHDSLHIYYADNPLGQWTAHSRNPILEHQASCSRPAGRLLVWKDRLYRFAQDCTPFYGAGVRAFEISKLGSTQYREKEIEKSPLLKGTGQGWNGISMHHIDVQKAGENDWIAVVDGRRH